jgi:hypothetical protein
MRISAQLALLGVLLAAAASLSAQEYTWQDMPAQKMRFQLHKKLAQVPMRIGDLTPNQVAKFEPEADGDYIWGRYGRFKWSLEIFEFQGTAPDDPDAPTTGEGSPPQGKDEAEAAARAAFKKDATKRTFEEWVKDPKNSGSNRRYLVEGKAQKATSKKLGFTWWEFTQTTAMVNGYGDQFDQVWHYTAAAFTMPDGREIALICGVPVKKDKPDQKWATIIKRMLTSVTAIAADPDEDLSDADRDKFAETEAQKKSLEILKDNIRNLDNWDYFTTPDFIITFGWSKPEQRKEMLRFSRWVGDRLEEARTMFRERFPPHENMKTNYSIIRVCHSYDEFRKYGETSYGVVGWFSPSSKEFVIYYDKQRELIGSEEEMLSVAYHEAWHQYSDQYWPDVELHRWFDEGMAEYFGAHRLKGKRKVYVALKGRIAEMQPLLGSKTYVPSAEIVAWDRATFYGANASAHYAQAWVMVDFLIRGPDKLGKRFDARWNEILPTYAKIALEEKAPKKAIETAFAGVDIEAYEAAWIDWFKSGKIKNP